MHTQTLRANTARTIAAGFLANTQGRDHVAHQCADGALVGLIALNAQGDQAGDLLDRIERLEHRLTHG